MVMSSSRIRSKNARLILKNLKVGWEFLGWIDAYSINGVSVKEHVLMRSPSGFTHEVKTGNAKRGSYQCKRGIRESNHKIVLERLLPGWSFVRWNDHTVIDGVRTTESVTLRSPQGYEYDVRTTCAKRGAYQCKNGIRDNKIALIKNNLKPGWKFIQWNPHKVVDGKSITENATLRSPLGFEYDIQSHIALKAKYQCTRSAKIHVGVIYAILDTKHGLAYIGQTTQGTKRFIDTRGHLGNSSQKYSRYLAQRLPDPIKNSLMYYGLNDTSNIGLIETCAHPQTHEVQIRIIDVIGGTVMCQATKHDLDQAERDAILAMADNDWKLLNRSMNPQHITGNKYRWGTTDPNTGEPTIRAPLFTEQNQYK